MPDMGAANLLALYGTLELLPVEVGLHAGPLEMTLRGGHLVDLMVAGHAVWEGVVFLYRDPHWCTPEPVFQRVVQEVQTQTEGVGQGFTLLLDGFIPTQPAIDISLVVRGDSQGVVTVRARAVPRGDILANRMGLCLMHPMSAIGQALDIEHVDGRISHAVFPEHVPPWPPFTGVRGIRHEYAAGHWASASFGGDEFEFEDEQSSGTAFRGFYLQAMQSCGWT